MHLDAKIASQVSRISWRNSLLGLLRDDRRHAKIALPLLHQLLEATAGPVPKAGLERHVARAPTAAFVLARFVAAATLPATLVVHLAGMVAGRGANACAGALVLAIRPFSATRIQTAANVWIGKERVLALRIIRARRG
jgi:hypothetical protein